MRLKFDNRKLERKFSRVYSNNLFNGSLSLSGNGSDLDQTKEVAIALPKLVKSLGIRSILDVPCGDLYWMSRIDFGNVAYIGADIVQEVIDSNINRYAADSKVFIQLDITKSVPPKVDIVFSRDLFVHLSTKDIKFALKNIFASKSEYLAMTTFSGAHDYSNLRKISRGIGWRPINFQSQPWSFPTPLQIIDEKCTEQGGNWSDKCIGVWRIKDLHGKI